ncbi:MAG: Ribonuclease P protein component [Candidatus Woesebacteria bacterium GW2011_GWA1_37_8]|uniref:Ribonuclease P protein component n=2 Tax=Candidatus Woeseibacteriota TaxID=1752722 RepID=A0A0G0L1W5_9BACT|nr:MAG: ribonuclease P protein component, ribonuclease P protein component [Microgenomates group bacterium GW2011_GWC1_37_12b]KKQ43237.1 MAG: Ribonuclease P protein component [Candidatus Woesebacteria bacterium GW2011_GWA1_37_8]KKQ85968.1 MAG: Ribonuclease P protein component [Candidatus Woesebacteria bacterium GW2011_GWB1_38_8b]
MLPSDRTLKATEYDKVKKLGKVYQSNSFQLLINDRKDKNLTKFGFIISNNVDKLAVHRNRVKRAMRESARQTMFSIPNGMDMIFIAKQNIVKMTTDEIMKEMKEYLLNTRFN